MSLYIKTLYIISVTIVCVIFCVFIASKYIILNSFSILEEQDIQQNVQRGLGSLSSEI